MKRRRMADERLGKIGELTAFLAQPLDGVHDEDEAGVLEVPGQPARQRDRTLSAFRGARVRAREGEPRPGRDRPKPVADQAHGVAQCRFPACEIDEDGRPGRGECAQERALAVARRCRHDRQRLARRLGQALHGPGRAGPQYGIDPRRIARGRQRLMHPALAAPWLPP
jgi:hypothetical protein